MIGDVGEIILQIRTEAGLSQEQLGRRAGVLRNNISQYEHKGVCPNVYRFEDLLNACGYELIIRKEGTKE